MFLAFVLLGVLQLLHLFFSVVGDHLYPHLSVSGHLLDIQLDLAVEIALFLDLTFQLLLVIGLLSAGLVELVLLGHLEFGCLAGLGHFLVAAQLDQLSFESSFLSELGLEILE